MADLIHDTSKGPCDLCPGLQQQGLPHHCTTCGAAIEVTHDKGPNGFSSPKPHHFHKTDRMTECFFGELCPGCYRAAYAATYPGITCPV